MKNMKKRISFLLVLVMLFAVMAVPANAVTIDGNKAIVTDAEIDGAILVSGLSDTVTVLCPEVAMLSEVEISAKSLAKVDKTGKNLAVVSAFASVEINHAAISDIVAQIGDSGVVALKLEINPEGKLNEAQSAALKGEQVLLVLNTDVVYDGKSLTLSSGFIVAKLPQMLVGDMIDQYVVAHLDENGKFNVVDTNYVDGYLQAKLDKLAVYVVMPKSEVPANPFVDVADTDWFYAPVLWAVENNITSGVDATHFGPYNNCTRAQVVTFLYAAAGRPDVTATEEPFEDVSKDDWFYTPVLWAVENGITSGIDATHFGPNKTCTRAAVVTFLYAMEGKPEITAKSEFADVADTDWFAKPVLWAVENKVTSGIGEGKFGPNNDCTRAAIVTFLKAAK